MHPKGNSWTLMKTLKKNCWIQNRNKPLRRTFNSKKQEMRQLNFELMEIVWNKRNLMIFSSVVYGHPVKYSYEIPHEFLSGLIARRCNIFGQFYLGKSYFFTLFRSNFFQSITRVTSSEQLFLQSTCFFEELLFSEQSLFLSIFFPE